MLLKRAVFVPFTEENCSLYNNFIENEGTNQ